MLFALMNAKAENNKYTLKLVNLVLIGVGSAEIHSSKIDQTAEFMLKRPNRINHPGNSLLRP